MVTQPTTFPRGAAWVAGLSLLIMTGLGPFGFFALQGHIDVGPTAENIAIIADGTRFYWVIWAFLAVAVLDIAVAWGLFLVFRSADFRLSLSSAVLRVVYAVALAGLVLHLTRAVGLAQEGSELSLQAIADFMNGWLIALGVFGLHLILLGIVGLKATNLHSAIAGLLMLAGLGYVADAVGPFVLPGYALNAAAYVFFGEVLLMFWLFFRAWRG